MKIDAKAVLIKENPEIFPIEVNEKNYVIVRKKLESERNKIIDQFKQWKEEGLIKSIFKPSNKKLNKKIDQLKDAKEEIDKSISKIKEIFYK